MSLKSLVGEIEGLYETELEICSSTVAVTGVVIDGEAMVGTAFITMEGTDERSVTA